MGLSGWRLLSLSMNNAFTNMAIDEAILTARIAKMVPNTLRLYKWKPSAVSIGRFQEARNEVNVENCREHSVDIVRRISGGGTVYHDDFGEVTYSVVLDGESLKSTDVVSVYNVICRGIIETARILGIKADFNSGDPKQCPNITIDGKKISGSAQYHTKDTFLQHGTFLVDVDAEKMFTFLRVPWAKTLKIVTCVAEKKLTSIRHELGTQPSEETVCRALVKGFENALDIELSEGDLTVYEKDIAERLRKQKYATDAWNLDRSSSLQDTVYL